MMNYGISDHSLTVVSVISTCIQQFIKERVYCLLLIELLNGVYHTSNFLTLSFRTQYLVLKCWETVPSTVNHFRHF